jgi:hypothetical protein
MKLSLVIFILVSGIMIGTHDVWGQWLKPLCVPPADTVCMKCHDPAPKERCDGTP